MTFLSVRRVISGCIVSAAAVAALAAPGTAAATSDLNAHCKGINIKGRGSTAQKDAQVNVWTPDFNTSANATACKGASPTVTYNNTLEEDKGSGACLKAFGAELGGETPAPLYKTYSYCGTDEAPSSGQEGEMESHAGAGELKEKESIETVPVVQFAVAMIVHLPAGCKAKSVVTTGTKKVKLGRLVLNEPTVAKIYSGEITKWSEIKESGDTLECTGGTAEEESTITPVVRKDKSGTTHVFKEFVSLASGDASVSVEGGFEGCPGGVKGVETKKWSEIAEGCENQRWPVAASVVRPASKGGGALVAEVVAKASSIGYANLADVRTNKSFSTKGVGGEIKPKGTETVQGEQNVKFWTEVQNKVGKESYTEPSSNGDTEKAGNSNCASTVYTEVAGKKFPPSSTRKTWNAAKAELNQAKYPLCGMTYDLALREYFPYLLPTGGTSAEEEEGKAQATTAHDFLQFVLNSGVEGGGTLIKNHDYEKLTTSIKEEAEDGVEELGYKEPGTAI
jgi:ABC-type phosphate transport system substrate-binding protein